MDNPLVSIITITLNRGDLIERCIKSVLNQTYTNIEHIIVDGASTDNTDEIIKKYPHLKFIKLKTNLPIIETVNVGFKNSKGRYIAFLDSDDEYLPTKIEKQVRLIETLSNDYGFVYCWMTFFDQNNGKFVRIHKAELRGNVAMEVVEKPIISGTPTYLFKRETFEYLGGWKDGIGIISDWELAARACQHYKVDYIPESLVNVYVNHGKQRMSEKKYYGVNLYKNLFVFHLYFLSEFKNVFDKYPKKKHLHLYNLSKASYYMNNWKNAIKYQCQLLKIDFSLKNLLLPVKVLYRKLF